MLEGYKPIDFGNMFSAQPDLSQVVRNRAGLTQAATAILANSEWSKTPVTSLLAAGLDVNTGKAPPRKQTLWGRVVDLLSTPAYAISNAADDALAGHQSDDDDSVLNDAKEILGGVFSGAGRGIATGLRGAFAGPETAADPQDKIYLGRFLQRFDLGMSPEEAAKPENKEKVRERLQQLASGDKTAGGDLLAGIPIIGGWLGFADSRPEDDGNISDKDIEEYFEDVELQGLLSSLGTDPLNFVGAPGLAGKVSKGAKGTAETFDASKLPKLNTGMPKTPSAFGKSPGSYKVNFSGSVQNAIANPATGELVTPPPWFNFPKSAADMDVTTATKNVETPVAKNTTDKLDDIINLWSTGASSPAKLDRTTKVRESLFPVAKIPDEQVHAASKFSNPEEVTKLTSDLLKRMATGDFSNAMQRLGTRYPGIPFNRTAKLIEHASTIPNFAKRLGIPGERQKIIEAFRRVITADAQSMKIPPKVKSSEQIVNEASQAGPVALEALVQGAKGQPVAKPKNPARDAQAVNDVVTKFKNQIVGTATPSGLRNPQKWSAAVAKGDNVRYSGPQQTQMWNYITSVLVKNVKSPARFAVANNILRQVEEEFMRLGSTPMSSFKTKGSVPIRLSQILDAIGPAAAAMDRTLLTKILRGDPNAIKNLPAGVVQKIEELKAGEAIVDSSNVVKGVDAASKNIEDLIKGPLSAGRKQEIVTIGSKVAEDITRNAGGSPVATKTASMATKDMFSTKAPGDGFSVANGTAILSHPDISTKLYKNFSNADKVARDIHAAIGGPTPKQLGTKSGSAARAIEWLGARFNAAYKNSDMRPIYLKNAATAKSTVARRADFLNKLAKTYDINDLDLWNDALKGAQGRLTPVPGSQSAELSREILQIMENLFGSSGLKSSVALENSVTGRAQLLMKELNSNLRRFGLGQFQFNKKGDYAEATKWLNSWEKWKIEQPLDFLFKIQNVVEHTVREKVMFDEIIARFASSTKGGPYKHSVNHPRLQGYYFGEQAASQINQFTKMLKEVATPNSKAMQTFDKALSKWKAGVTIYIPSHHIRNMIGDLYFNWLGGVNNVKVYSTALKVMQAQKGRYTGIAELDNLTNPNAVRRMLEGRYTPTALGKQTALTMKNGTNVTNDMVYISAFQEGILPTTRVLEDIPDDVAQGLEKIRPLGGRGQKAAHKISEGRDHYVRLAHYIDALKKSNKSFEAATSDAAAIVRKWHPDGMDLTKFERNVMRRMFPFYSWTRKAFPLIVESMVATPGKVMAIPKAQYLLQNSLGMDTGPMSDPFPYDQLFPDWIREKGIGPIMGEPGDYTVINPGNPTMDLISQMADPGKMAMGMLNPAARIPIEVATGRDVQSGAPIEGITDTDYIAKQIPGVSHLGRATGEFGVSDTVKAQSEGVNMQNIANMLTAMGIQNTGPYIKSAEFDLRDFLKSLRQ